jgi:hypothetical protein
VRRASLGLTLPAILLAGASHAGAGGFDVRIGGYFPRGNETLFQDVRDLYFVEKSDFYGLYGGVEYNHVVATASSWPCTSTATAGRWTPPTATGPARTGARSAVAAALRMAPLGVSVRLLPTSKRTRSPPSWGAGSRRLLQVRGVRRLHRLLRPHPADHPGRLLRGRSRLRPPRPRRAPGLPEPGRRDRRGGALPVGGGRHGRRLLPERAGAREPLDLSGATFTIGVHVRF